MDAEHRLPTHPKGHAGAMARHPMYCWGRVIFIHQWICRLVGRVSRTAYPSTASDWIMWKHRHPRAGTGNSGSYEDELEFERGPWPFSNNDFVRAQGRYADDGTF